MRAHSSSESRRRKAVRPDLVPARDARPIGTHSDGRMIFEAERRDMEATKNNKVPVLDALGNPVFRKDANGQEYPVMRAQPVMKTVQFVLERSPSGKVREVYNFKQTQDEKVADAAKVMQKEFASQLAREATRRGMTAEDMIGRLLEPLEGAEVSAERAKYPIHRHGPHWILSNGENFQGNKKAAMHAEALVAGVVFAENADEGEEELVAVLPEEGEDF